jgi:hypothetical protein
MQAWASDRLGREMAKALTQEQTDLLSLLAQALM